MKYLDEGDDIIIVRLCGSLLNLIRLLSYLLKDIVLVVDKLTEEKYMINRLIVKFDKL